MLPLSGEAHMRTRRYDFVTVRLMVDSDRWHRLVHGETNGPSETGAANAALS